MAGTPSSAFSTRLAYKALPASDQKSPDAGKVWQMKLPTKVKFLGWLLLHGRLSTKANLHRKNIRSLEDSFCDFCPGVLETDDHIFADCPRATAVWDRLGVTMHSAEFQRPWLLGCSLSLPDEVRGMFSSPFSGIFGKPGMCESSTSRHSRRRKC